MKIPKMFELPPPRYMPNMGVSKNRGTPNSKMDGENNGTPYQQMDDLGGFPTPIFGSTPICQINLKQPDLQKCNLLDSFGAMT